ncbi:hypothetical protein D3C75_837450 [compost metagenome]
MSSSWRIRAALLRQSASGCMAVPEEYAPGSVIERVTMVIPETNTLSQTSMCPTMPTPPAMVQCLPMRVLPEIPTQAAMAVCSPICTLWAIWIWLSSLTPSAIRVSDNAPRSTAVFTPISTSSPMVTPPIWAILRHTPFSLAKPKPSPPITAPDWMTTRLPMVTS